MNDLFLKKEDYEEPACPFCTDAYKSEPIIRSIPIDRIIRRLDEHFEKKEFDFAEKLLLYWLDEAKSGRDVRGELTICNELMGFYRKTGKKDEAIGAAQRGVELAQQPQFTDSSVAGTTFVNAATVFKAFGLPEKAMPYFESAEKIYAETLSSDDEKFGGLYNNMALALTDLKRYSEAYIYYNKAIEVMKSNENGELEIAITYLNMANLAESQKGLEEAQDDITQYIESAMALLDSKKDENDGYYAFVCEKCAPTFGYYGYFAYENELNRRIGRFYERN